MTGILGANGRPVNGAVVGPDGKPVASWPVAAQGFVKDMIRTLINLPSVRDALTVANDTLKLHAQLPDRGQRITLHMMSMVAGWQEQAIAALHEYDQKPTADEAAPSPGPSPSEEESASHPPSASPTPPAG